MASFLLQNGVDTLIQQDGSDLLLNDGTPAPFYGAIRVRAKGSGGDGVGILTAELREGGVLRATLRVMLSNSYQTFTQYLTSTEYSAIANTLTLELWVTGTFDGSPFKQVDVSWIDLELPVVSSSSNTDITSPLISVTSSVLSNTLSATGNVTSPLITESSTLNTNTLAATSNVTSPLITESSTLNTNTLSATGNVTSPLITESSTLNTNTLSATGNVTSPLITESSTLYVITPTSLSPVNLPSPLITKAFTLNTNQLIATASVTSTSISVVSTLLGTSRSATGNVTAPVVTPTTTIPLASVASYVFIVVSSISSTSTLYLLNIAKLELLLRAKVWDGSVWLPKYERMWNGGSWGVDYRAKAYDPATSQWITINA